MAWTVDLLADGAPRIGSGFGRNWRVDVQTVVGSSTYICKYLAGPVHRRKYLEYIERRARLAGNYQYHHRIRILHITDGGDCMNCLPYSSRVVGFSFANFEGSSGLLRLPLPRATVMSSRYPFTRPVGSQLAERARGLERTQSN